MVKLATVYGTNLFFVKITRLQSFNKLPAARDIEIFRSTRCELNADNYDMLYSKRAAILECTSVDF
jgi:hypothetical protein